MAVQAKNSADINFGVHNAAFTYTHVRTRVADDDSTPVTTTLSTPLVGLATNNAVLSAGELKFKISSGTAGQGSEVDVFLKDLFDTKYGKAGSKINFEIDALTDATTVSTISGYNQQVATFDVETVSN